ncbi:MAG: PAS domain S-box protein [Bacteroidia bacterium]|nr:PAS domain S-box protein [Bacteroidia bacterium]
MPKLKEIFLNIATSGLQGTLRKTRDHTIPGYSVVILMFLLALFLLFNGGSEKSGYVWFYIFPTTCLFILGKKGGLQFIMASVIFSLIILYLFPFIDFIKDHVCDYSPVVKFCFISSYFAVSVLSYVFEATREKSYKLQVEARKKADVLLEQSLKNQRLIQSQKDELEKINKELEKLSIVASETENAVAIATVEGLIEWVNAGFTKLYGYTYEEFIKEKGANVIKASTNPDILEAIIECLGSRQPVIYTSPNETRDGKKIWVQTTLTPVYDISGTITKLVLIDSDITKIIEAEEEIKQQNEEIKQQNEEIKSQRDLLEDANKELEKLSIVAKETDNSVVIADKDGNIEWVNYGFSKLWGYNLNEFRIAKSNNIMDHKNNRHVSGLIKDFKENKRSVVYVVPATNKEGKAIWIQTTLTPILDQAARISRIVAIEAEITDIKEAEEEIKQQNEEIKQQNEEISSQRDSLNEILNEISKKNELLTDSIQYAKLIQNSILPKQEEIKKYHPESFIYFKPKDIVSGDFYWFHGGGEQYIIAVADCTGHGVPGAFMSMIGNTLLNKIVNEENIYDPEMILHKLNIGIIESLNQGSDYSEIQDDGMDISVCLADMKKNELIISCANQIAFIIENGKVRSIRGSIYSIGGLISYKSSPVFHNDKFKIDKGTTVYLISDGYQDQFGGVDYDKFGILRFESLLGSIHRLPMKEQQKILEQTHEEWRDKRNQTDDILVLGFRF